MLVLVLLALLLGLGVLRHLVEPSCPCCSAKRWSGHPTVLECRRCGWSNASPSEPRGPQYELLLQLVNQ